jgi:hypothetical protein
MARKLKSDKVLFLTTILLVGLSIVMVYSASAPMALDRYGKASTFLVRQAMWAVLGLALMAIVMRIDYRTYREPVFIWTCVGVVGSAVAIHDEPRIAGKHGRCIERCRETAREFARTDVPGDVLPGREFREPEPVERCRDRPAGVVANDQRRRPAVLAQDDEWRRIVAAKQRGTTGRGVWDGQGRSRDGSRGRKFTGCKCARSEALCARPGRGGSSPGAAAPGRFAASTGVDDATGEDVTRFTPSGVPAPYHPQVTSSDTAGTGRCSRDESAFRQVEPSTLTVPLAWHPTGRERARRRTACDFGQPTRQVPVRDRDPVAGAVALNRPCP